MSTGTRRSPIARVSKLNKIVEINKYVQRADETDGAFEHNSIRVLLTHIHHPAYVAQLLDTNEC